MPLATRKHRSPSSPAATHSTPRSDDDAPSLLRRLHRLFPLRLSPKRLIAQWQLFLFLSALFASNAVLAVARAREFVGMRNLDGSRPNLFYMVSRACGRCLLLDSVLVFALVLRYTATRLRNAGASAFLPLDHNVYIHKIVGWVVFALSWTHSLMHLCTFTFNVTPDPLKFVQMNSRFWDVSRDVADEEADETKPNWQRLGYRLPEGCSVAQCNRTDFEVNSTAPKMCQWCNGTGADGRGPWEAWEWLLTPRPGVFGLVGGAANPTGVALAASLTIMAVCSLPVVRKKGYFEVFYFTHLLYWAYVGLLIVHAPAFWKWILVPLAVFVVEKAYRAASTVAGRGKSYIIEGVTMASKVTKLVIKRPYSFKHSPGDWLFLRIPAIANYEWHPFTISSAPEERDVLTVHVRGVGQWTNRVYQLFEERKARTLSRVQGDLSSTNFGLEYEMEAFGMPGGRSDLRSLEIHLDGPFGAPATDIFRSEHAVLVATGIGVTPFSSILQSIMHRYLEAKRICPNCQHKWCVDLGKSMLNLKKVDFFWINRDQRSFEWFVSLLDQMEQEQEEAGCGVGGGSSEDQGPPCQGQKSKEKFLDFHLYFTSALQRTDMRAVGLQLAMDLIHKKEHRDVMTKLKVRTKAGRPNWHRAFSRLRDSGRGRVTVFYCGNPGLGKVLRARCHDFGFGFRKENF